MGTFTFAHDVNKVIYEYFILKFSNINKRVSPIETKLCGIY